MIKMKNLKYLFIAFVFVACSSDDGNDCVYTPTLETLAITDIIQTTATLNGIISIVSENCDAPNNTEQGFVFATTIQPTTNDNQVNVNGVNVTTTIENLEANTTYYVRTFLTNALGEFYGNEVSFLTNDEGDTTAPVITVLGEANVTVIQYTTYIDAGATATDNVDGDLTSSIVTSGEVDINVLGPYAITYSVSDAAGNIATASRQVIVEANPVYLDNNGITIKAYEWADVGAMGEINGVMYTVVDEAMLREMADYGEDITKVVTTKVNDMSEIFFIDYQTPSNFNQDISNWDVSNVTSMIWMFANTTAFNQDISNWDVSNVTNMTGMFNYTTAFNQDISNWDVSNVISMGSMFDNTTAFNQDISNWDVSNVISMIWMFANTTAFNQDISNWDVSNVTNMTGMFANTTAFNQPIGDWDVSNVTNMLLMFHQNLAFNQPIGDWDVSNVTNMHQMFYIAESFNQDLGDWDVSNVTDCWFFSYNTPQWTLPKPNFTNC